MHFKIILSANSKVYELNSPDDILDININYDNFVAIDLEINNEGRYYKCPILFKSPKDNYFLYERNLSSIDFKIDRRLDSVFEDLRSLLPYLNQDVDNFNELKGE